MQQSLARADDDLGNIIRGLAAEIEVSVALSRAMMRTLAALSPTCAATAGAVLEDEAVRALEEHNQHIIDAIDDVQSRLRNARQEDVMAQAVERALIQAADRTNGGPALVLDLRYEAGPHAAKAF